MGAERPDFQKRVYLVTLPHPQQQAASNGRALVAPGSKTRAEVLAALQAACQAAWAGRAAPLQLQRAAVFQERHCGGATHYHVALLANRPFRFAPVKEALLAASGLASHWSSTHDGYHSCVAYCYVPTPRKQQADLDGEPLLWPADHPALAEASRAPVTARATAANAERARRLQAEKGKPERFSVIQLWPVVIAQNFRGPAAAEALMSYAKRCGGQTMVEWLFANWQKVPDLIERCWEVEQVEDFVARANKSRLDLVGEAAETPCRCGGHWCSMAQELFTKNSLDQSDWRESVLRSLEKGRCKGTLVTHAGHAGNEGKSFLFAPFGEIFGAEAVFTCPPEGSFPLVGLEKARVALLEDWRFNEWVVSWTLQLLWFEGKPIVIARPQNHCKGHLRYSGDAPIFITTLKSDLDGLDGKGIAAGDLAMMKKRLKVFEFKHVFPHREVAACARCFARFLVGSAAPLPAPAPVSPPPSAAGSSNPAAAAAPAPKRRCVAWGIAEVVDYVTSLGFAHAAPAFRENGVDGEFLAGLTVSDLQEELGLTRLQAKKVLDRLP